MRRSASRLPRILAVAAVPALLVVAGCSSGSGSGGASDDTGGSSSSGSPSSRPSPSVAPAKYTSLPEACKTVGGGTIDDLVPKAKNKKGTEGTSSDVTLRGSCSWNGLKDNGVKGSQYRWLDVSMMRFTSQPSIGTGDAQAAKHFAEEVANAQATQDAKSVMTTPASGVGSQASVVTYTLRKTDTDFSYATVVVRADNVVLTLNYNGAGYAGAKSPSQSDVSKDALTAAKQAVGVVEGGTASSGGTGSGSSAGSGKSPSKSPSGGASPSASSGKKSGASSSPSGAAVGHAPSGPGTSSASPSSDASMAG